MATAPVSRKLNLTRDQLSQFLSDQLQIKQFENLFAVVDELQVITGTDFEFQADTAAANANLALGLLSNLAQETAINAALAENKANQALALVDKLTSVIEGLQMTPPARELKRARYGSFYDTTTQVATVINTAKAMTFNNTDLSNGVFLSTSSRIMVDTAGIYNYDVSFQLDKTSGGTAVFDMWFRLNGVNVTNSASRIAIQGNNAEIFSSLNYFFNLAAGDYIELMFAVTDLSVQIAAFPAAAPIPGIASIILTVNNNIEGVQ